MWWEICDLDYEQHIKDYKVFHNIIICTPPETHKEVLETILRETDAYDKILMEKPFLTTTCETMLTRWEDVYVVCNMRYHPAIQTLKQNVHLIGGCMYVNAGYMYAAQGNHLNAVWDSTHELDYTQWLLGPIFEITNKGINTQRVDYSISYNRGQTVGTIHFMNFGVVKRRWCKLIGIKGTLEWNSYGKNPERATVTFTDLAGQVKTVYHSSNINPDQMYLDMLKDFLLSPTKLQSAQNAYDILQQILPD